MSKLCLFIYFIGWNQHCLCSRERPGHVCVQWERERFVRREKRGTRNRQSQCKASNHYVASQRVRGRNRLCDRLLLWLFNCGRLVAVLRRDCQLRFPFSHTTAAVMFRFHHLHQRPNDNKNERLHKRYPCDRCGCNFIGCKLKLTEIAEAFQSTTLTCPGYHFSLKPRR